MDPLRISSVNIYTCPRFVEQAYPKCWQLNWRRPGWPSAETLFSRFNENPADSHSRLVSCDKTWIHYYDPEFKQESVQWKHVGFPTTIKFKASKSFKKIMTTVFRDSQGVMHIDYLPSDKTMTGNYYADLLHHLRQSIETKRGGKLRLGVVLNRTMLQSTSARSRWLLWRSVDMKLLPHLPYSQIWLPVTTTWLGIWRNTFVGGDLRMKMTSLGL